MNVVLRECEAFMPNILDNGLTMITSKGNNPGDLVDTWVRFQVNHFLHLFQYYDKECEHYKYTIAQGNTIYLNDKDNQTVTMFGKLWFLEV